MIEKALTPAEQVRRLYEDAENRTGTAMEELVSSNAFGEVLAMVTSNAMAMTRMASEGLDQVVRSIRLAGRSDITRLARQLARTEDKLEQVLQLVERLESELADARNEGGPAKGVDGARRATGSTAEPAETDATPAPRGRGSGSRAAAGTRARDER
jgi:hypothetical protein